MERGWNDREEENEAPTAVVSPRPGASSRTSRGPSEKGRNGRSRGPLPSFPSRRKRRTRHSLGRGGSLHDGRQHPRRGGHPAQRSLYRGYRKGAGDGRTSPRREGPASRGGTERKLRRRRETQDVGGHYPATSERLTRRYQSEICETHKAEP